MGRRARNKCEPVALAGVIDRRERVNNGSCLFAEGGSFCFCFVFSAKGLKGVAKTIASERTVSGLHYFSLSLLTRPSSDWITLPAGFQTKEYMPTCIRVLFLAFPELCSFFFSLFFFFAEWSCVFCQAFIYSSFKIYPCRESFLLTRNCDHSASTREIVAVDCACWEEPCATNR